MEQKGIGHILDSFPVSQYNVEMISYLALSVTSCSIKNSIIVSNSSIFIETIIDLLFCNALECK